MPDEDCHLFHEQRCRNYRNPHLFELREHGIADEQRGWIGMPDTDCRASSHRKLQQLFQLSER
jgi:hypothetical protein